VWLTAESLGTDDPALTAHPDVPAVFVFDEPLLATLRLSGKRLVFLAEALAELDAEVHLGNPRTELAGRRLATTWTFAPGWKTRSAALDITALHPWPWLRRPGSGSLRSYSAWVR
jgi:deoxyribodipyrimidine photo-lyase